MSTRRARRPTSQLQHVLLAHPSPDLYGSDRMLVESVAALVRSGLTVTVTLPVDGPLAPLLRDAGAEVVVLETPVLRKAMLSPAGLVRLAAVFARTVPTMHRLLRDRSIDLVYVNTVTLPGWLLAGRLARLPVVCHVHEAENGLGRIVGMGLHAPLLLARRVIVNSASAQETLVSILPRLKRRTHLVYNGVPGPSVPLPQLRGSVEGPAQLLLVGRLSPRKGSDLAIGALAELRSGGIAARLVLAGSVFPGYEWFETQLREQARELGLEDAVEFLGFVDDVWPALATCDVVLVPSRAEPFGNVAVEAALAGRPVVAAAVQGLQEIVRDGITGRLVAPDDAVALAGGIADLLADWATTQLMAAAAHADAVKRFGVERYGLAVIELLRDAQLGRP